VATIGDFRVAITTTQERLGKNTASANFERSLSLVWPAGRSKICQLRLDLNHHERRLVLPDGVPTIILLGGTHGVGKTTVAHHLGTQLSIRQRSGAGVILNAIQTVMPDSVAFTAHWHQCDHRDRDQVRDMLRRESELIGRVINRIVDGACYTGESYIIDGVNLLPEFLPLNRIRYYALTCSDEESHRRRFEQPETTRTRHNSVRSYDLAKTVESVLFEEILPFDVPVIDNTEQPEITAHRIVTTIREAHGWQ
jgi:2-phosphoglycerate kinase